METAEPPLTEVETLPAKQALGRLVLVLAEIEDLREKAQCSVDEAREQGATWHDIGNAAGISRQAAYDRFTEKGRARNRENQRKRRQQQSE